ncbi:hypothetical protein BJ322DRAFT_1109980 [Thelephora terrestris]|uniref:Uncharacterized protein n=1 Tax=Thelephora terrestris TaxID=56493 RepID=A0A9P6HC99_9AGAM|nr:hypothetical protein BJ322DRAFT_1114802 [Thelephora terrestris]KAF9784121.1 hypothetical protein BJ322DRAFT_1109980 [Thelephora terrestris]
MFVVSLSLAPIKGWPDTWTTWLACPQSYLMLQGGKMVSTSSPAPPDARVVFSNRVTPVTPTPKRNRGVGDLVRSPITTQEFISKKTSREDSIFQVYKTELRRKTTLVTFEWDPESSTGDLIPVRYPVDEKGEPVEPLLLPEFLKTHNWDRPSCFCVMRGSPRTTQFLVPTWRESQSYNMMCLVCPDSKCSYFVNVSELMDKYKDQVLSVKDTDATEGDSETSSGDIAVDIAPKKRKRDLRGL